MAGRRTLLEGSSLRKNVREQVTQLLRQNHVEITADIRKALPSRRAPGDPQRLSQLLGNAAMHLEVHDFASLKPHLQFEIDKLASAAASGNPASLEGFLPDGSGTAQKALLDLLRPAFEAQANDMAAQAFEKFARGLMFGKSINEAMDQAFEDLNGQFRSLKPGGEFHEARRMLSALLDDAGTATAARTFAGESRKLLASALLVSAFISLLAHALDKRQKLFQMAVQDFCKVNGAEAEEGDTRAEQRERTSVSMKEVWSLNPSARAARLAASQFPSLSTSKQAKS